MLILTWAFLRMLSICLFLRKALTLAFFLDNLSRRLWISVTDKLTAAKTMIPNFLFSILGTVYSHFAIFLCCSATYWTANSNETWIELRYSTLADKVSFNFFSHLAHSCAYKPLVDSNLPCLLVWRLYRFIPTCKINLKETGRRLLSGFSNGILTRKPKCSTSSSLKYLRLFPS